MVLSYNQDIIPQYSISQFLFSVCRNDKAVQPIEYEGYGFGERRLLFILGDDQAALRLMKGFKCRHKANSRTAVIGVCSHLLLADPRQRIHIKIHAVITNSDLKDTVFLFDRHKNSAVSDPRRLNGDDRVLDMIAKQRLQIGLADNIIDQIIRFLAHRQIKADPTRGGFDIQLAQRAVDQRKTS